MKTSGINIFQFSFLQAFLQNYFTKNIQYQKNIADFCEVNFYISKLFSQCNKGNCCVHIRGDIYVSVSAYLSLFSLCIFVDVGDIKSGCQQKPCHPYQTLRTFNFQLHKANSKVLLILKQKTCCIKHKTNSNVLLGLKSLGLQH